VSHRTSRFLSCLVILLVSVAGAACSRGADGPEQPRRFAPLTYRSQVGGCILYVRQGSAVSMLPDLSSLTGVTTPGAKVEVPESTGWGVVALTHGLSDLVAEWNQNQIPELMILDEQQGPRITDQEVAALERVRSIRRLDLSSCPLLTDRSLASLKSLEKLRVLLLPTGGPITEGAVAALCRDRPSLQVVRATPATLSAALER